MILTITFQQTSLFSGVCVGVDVVDAIQHFDALSLFQSQRYDMESFSWDATGKEYSYSPLYK